MDARTQVDTQVVGALPLVGAMLEQWGLAGIVDEVAPWDGDVPLGTLVEVLLTNRLLNPKAMYAVGDWAAGAAAKPSPRACRRSFHASPRTTRPVLGDRSGSATRAPARAPCVRT